MKFSCEIQTFSTIKKGSRITLALDDEATEIVLKGIQNYNKLPLTCELAVDVEQRKEQLAQINPDQRAKTYAIIKDIAAWMGDSPDSVKLELKRQFCFDKGHDEFSLSNCSRELASDFIEYLIGWCFESGVPLKEHPKEYLEDIEAYIAICLKNNVCIVCGQPAVKHHTTGSRIGMGRNRNKIDDSEAVKIPLCNIHHSDFIEYEDEFLKKYHLI